MDWGILNKTTNKQLLLVHGEMTYPFAISREALSTKFGHKCQGGWKWHGWGYGYLNLFLPSDPRVLHIDIQEAVFFGEDIFTLYHLSGRGCRNVDKSEDVICKEGECGVRIWSVMFSSFTTVEESREYYQPRSFRKEKEEKTVYLSLVKFFNGELKIALHRDARLKKSYEEVAWLTKDEARFNDTVAAVDRSKLQRAEQVWATRVPKPVAGGDTLTDTVSKSNLSLRDLGLFVCYIRFGNLLCCLLHELCVMHSLALAIQYSLLLHCCIVKEQKVAGPVVANIVVRAPVGADSDYTFCLPISFSFNIFYPQGNGESSNQSREQEGERQEFEEFLEEFVEFLEETGAERQEGGATAVDTLAAEVSKLNLCLRGLRMCDCLFVCLVTCFVCLFVV